jgi:Zn-dependent oligopeptidase
MIVLSTGSNTRVSRFNTRVNNSRGLFTLSYASIDDDEYETVQVPEQKTVNLGVDMAKLEGAGDSTSLLTW